MLRKIALVLWVSLMPGSSAAAQNWAEKMFEVTQHDFGTVAKGAKTQFEFVLKNIYVEDVHIASVTSSCGCTTPSITKPLLKTYEKGSILAVYNTHLFEGRKGATLTVTFDKPYFAQVQLHVTGFIRRDVVLNPGAVDFGTVEQGTPAEVGIAVGYAGRSDWQVTAVKSENPYLKTRLVEHQRQFGQVVYHLFVRLDENAPPGRLNEHLMLVTNDPVSPNVPVPVYGTVQSGVTVPSTLFMGVLEPGQKVTKSLVIRGTKPFRILSITADGEGLEFDTRGVDVPKTLHVIPVTFVAGDRPGRVTKTIKIETDLGHKAPSLSAYADVAAR